MNDALTPVPKVYKEKHKLMSTYAYVFLVYCDYNWNFVLDFVLKLRNTDNAPTPIWNKQYIKL